MACSVPVHSDCRLCYIFLCSSGEAHDYFIEIMKREERHYKINYGAGCVQVIDQKKQSAYSQRIIDQQFKGDRARKGGSMNSGLSHLSVEVDDR